MALGFFDIIFPNFNALTAVGFLIIIFGILWLLFLPIKSIGAIGIIGGIVLVYGISLIQDALSTTTGKVIAAGLVVIALVWFILFWEPKKKGLGRPRKNC